MEQSKRLTAEPKFNSTFTKEGGQGYMNYPRPTTATSQSIPLKVVGVNNRYS